MGMWEGRKEEIVRRKRERDKNANRFEDGKGMRMMKSRIYQSFMERKKNTKCLRGYM